MSLDIAALYRRMLVISTEMLSAANDEDWDKLIELEQKRSGVLEALQTSPNLIPDTQEERDVLVELIMGIQKHDEKVKPLILTWMDELRSMFESKGNELKLEKQYGSF